MSVKVTVVVMALRRLLNAAWRCTTKPVLRPPDVCGRLPCIRADSSVDGWGCSLNKARRCCLACRSKRSIT